MTCLSFRRHHHHVSSWDLRCQWQWQSRKAINRKLTVYRTNFTQLSHHSICKFSPLSVPSIHIDSVHCDLIKWYTFEECSIGCCFYPNFNGNGPCLLFIWSTMTHNSWMLKSCYRWQRSFTVNMLCNLFLPAPNLLFAFNAIGSVSVQISENYYFFPF